jgi:hypothetical protein
MRPIRKRLVLIVTLIVSQTAALALLAGALWLAKVKETAKGEIISAVADGDRFILDVQLNGQNDLSFPIDGIVYGNTSAGSFTARVISQSTNEGKTSFRAIVLQNASRLFAGDTGTTDVSVWVRKRRALSILLDRSATQKGLGF